MSRRLSVVAAFIRRDWMTARSYRFGFALQLIQMGFLLALFFFLGRIVDVSSLAQKAHVHAHGYFAFVVVGLMLFEIMNVGLHSFAIRLREDQVTGTLEALFVTPAPHGLIVVAGAAYDLIRATGLGVLMLIIGVVVAGVDLTLHAWSPLVVVLALVTSLVFFAALGVVIAGATVVFKQISVLTGFLTTGLALLGGVYFPVSVLPGVLRALAGASPVTWALDVMRAGLLGGRLPLGQLLLLIAAAAVTLPASLVLFTACLHRAKQVGSLAQY